MAGCSPPSTPWHQNSGKGGHIIDCCRNGLWRRLTPSRTIFHLVGYVSSAGPCRLMSRSSDIICSDFALHHPALHTDAATCTVLWTLPHTFLSDTKPFANDYDHHTMDRSQWSTAQTSILLWTFMIVRTPCRLTV
jgi:hypothetical protein